MPSSQAKDGCHDPVHVGSLICTRCPDIDSKLYGRRSPSTLWIVYSAPCPKGNVHQAQHRCNLQFPVGPAACIGSGGAWSDFQGREHTNLAECEGTRDRCSLPLPASSDLIEAQSAIISPHGASMSSHQTCLRLNQPSSGLKEPQSALIRPD